MNSGDIIQQGEWGYGNVDGLSKDVNEGYKKFLKKNGLEHELSAFQGGRPKKSRGIVFGEAEEDDPIKN